MERQLKPYMGFAITKYTTKEHTKWVAKNEDRYYCESNESLADLKRTIRLNYQTKRLGTYLGRALGLGLSK